MGAALVYLFFFYIAEKAKKRTTICGMNTFIEHLSHLSYTTYKKYKSMEDAVATISISIQNRRRHAVTCTGFSQEGDVEVPAGATVTVLQTTPMLEPMEVCVTDSFINESVKGKLRLSVNDIHLSVCNYALVEPACIVKHTVPFRDSPDVDVHEWLVAAGLRHEGPRWIPIVLKWKQDVRTSTSRNPAYTLVITNS